MKYQLILYKDIYTVKQANQGLSDTEFQLKCKFVTDNNANVMLFSSDWAAKEWVYKNVWDDSDFLSTESWNELVHFLAHQEDSVETAVHPMKSTLRPYDKWEQRPIIW